jgi:hypothetical protein
MSGGNWKELFMAGCEGDLALVDYHRKCGVDLNYAHPEFLTTPLVGAILAGQEAVALYLLEHGALPDLPSELDAITPLGAARRMALPAVEARLLALGAPPEATPTPTPTPSAAGGPLWGLVPRSWLGRRPSRP